MDSIKEAVEAINIAVEESAKGVKHLVTDMTEITSRMDVNHKVAAELEQETITFANL